MNAHRRTHQSGAALILMLAILVLGASWLLVNALSAPQDRTALERAHNARVLNEAKRALIGYVATEAAKTGENNPGHIPCPEALGNIGTANEGIESTFCAASPMGRLPWRTLGIDQLRDAAGEPLWLVVAQGWRRVNSATPTVINSDCDDVTSTRLCSTSRLTVDGVPMAAVALIIAPGRPFQVASQPPNCTAFGQTRAGTPVADPRNYLECQNAGAGTTYVSSGPSDSFNDQVLAVSAADILPAIEAAVAQRFERQIAPQIVSAYSNIDGANTLWPTTNSVLPFAAPMADPTTSNLKGTRTTSGLATTGTYQGLLPLNRVRTRCTPVAPATECTPAACTGGADCDANFIAWTGTPTMSGPNLYSPSCSVSGTEVVCRFHVRTPLLPIFGPPPASVSFTLNATAQNVGMGFRQFQSNVPMSGVLSTGRTVTGALAADGSANITLNANADTSDLDNGGLLGFVLSAVCGIGFPLGLTIGCAQDEIRIPIAMFVDHPLTDANDATYGWFRRNLWHEVTYYALAPAVAPSGAGSCTSGTDCLTVTYRSPSNTYRALLAFAGRPLTTTVPPQARPAMSVADLFEGGNGLVSNAAPLTPFVARDPTLTVNRSFTDHIAIIDSN
jgi:hypothetical protein